MYIIVGFILNSGGWLVFIRIWAFSRINKVYIHVYILFSIFTACFLMSLQGDC